MNKVKWGLLAFVGLLVITAGGTFYYMTAKTAYYTQIVSTGEKTTSQVQGSKEKFVEYRYVQTGYNEQGEARELTFKTHPSLGRPFKKHAYLKIVVNRWKGEVGYEEVQPTQVPEKALAKLQ